MATATTNFYNTAGYYYNSSNNSTAASDHYVVGSSKKWRMKITSSMMSQIKGEVISASVRMYNQNYYNTTYTWYAYASQSTSVSESLTDGNYGGKTSTNSLKLSEAWMEWNFDVTSAFQYAQDNYSGDWWLWFRWTGDADKNMIGYNNDSYAASRCPYFTITYKEGTVCYVHNGSTWVEATPYVHNGSGWQVATPKVYSGEWN